MNVLWQQLVIPSLNVLPLGLTIIPSPNALRPSHSFTERNVVILSLNVLRPGLSLSHSDDEEPYYEPSASERRWLGICLASWTSWTFVHWRLKSTPETGQSTQGNGLHTLPLRILLLKVMDFLKRHLLKLIYLLKDMDILESPFREVILAFKVMDFLDFLYKLQATERRWGHQACPSCCYPWLCSSVTNSVNLQSQAAQSRCTVVRPMQKSIGKWEIRPSVKS